MPVHIVVHEFAEKASLDNPGGQELEAKLGGKDAGLPFFAFLDGGGGMIVNSIRPANGVANIGYPGEPQEIDWFMVMLGKAAPGMPPVESTVIEQWLRKHNR